MEIISKSFTYDVPDLYLTTDTTEGKTGTVTYNGPDEMWVFVNKQTGKLNWAMHCIPNSDISMQELAEIHAGQDHKAILVNFTQNPLICWAMFGEYDEENASVTELTLDGETEPYFTQFDPVPPNDIYDFASFVYLFNNNAWQTPFPMLTPQRTEEAFLENLNEIVEDIDEIIADDEHPNSYNEALEAYKAEIQNLPTRFAGVPFYMWKMPESPEIKRTVDIEPDDEDEIWDSAPDGSEGPGAATGYQPTSDSPTNIVVDPDAPVPAGEDTDQEGTDLAGSES
jgi:hypothetical protein